MTPNITGKAYYAFMFLLPLVFYTALSDVVLLPRQLFLTAFVTLLFIVYWKSNKEIGRIQLNAIELGFGVYLAIATVISLINSIVLSESLYFLSKSLILFAFLVLTLRLLERNIITINQLTTAVILFGIVAIITVAPSIIEKTLRGKHILKFVSNIAGSFGNKNLLSSILFLCLPFFMIGCHRRNLIKLASFIGLFLAIFILIIIRTRTTLVATAVFFGIVAFFFLSKYFGRRIWWLMLTVVAIAAIGVNFLLNSISGVHSSSDVVTKYFIRLFNTDTLKERVLFWENSIKMFSEYPLGVGLGNWQIHFPKYGLSKFDTFEMVNGLHTLQRPHNDFLWVLCETGILGFIAFASIFGLVVYQSFSLIKLAADKYERRMSVYLFAALVGFIIISFVDFPMERIEHQIILMLIFAIITYQYNLKTATHFTFPARKIFVAAFLVLGIGFSFVVTYQRIQSELLVSKLYTAKKSGNTIDVMFFAKKAESVFYKIDSKTIPLKWYLGTGHFSQGQFLDAETAFSEAYALTPYNIHVINNLASCYEVNGRRKEAIEMYSKALKISPMFDEARLNLSAVYFNNKDFDKAFKTIDVVDNSTSDPKYKIFLPVILKVGSSRVDLQACKLEYSIVSPK